MEEEWMRDRALLRDLLQKTPQASPRELAQAIGRSVSWVKKWRKRLTEGDPHDPHLFCSQSRAHHAPYFRWDIQVTKKIVEMRFAPPENADRGCLGPGLCSTTFPVTQSCKPHRFLYPAPAERSGRSCMLLAAWFLVPKSSRTPMSSESRWKRSRWISRISGVSHLNRVRKASVSMWSKSATLWMQALRLPCLPRRERISTNKPPWKR
jgi:hypothetical protein